MRRWMSAGLIAAMTVAGISVTTGTVHAHAPVTTNIGAVRGVPQEVIDYLLRHRSNVDLKRVKMVNGQDELDQAMADPKASAIVIVSADTARKYNDVVLSKESANPQAPIIAYGTKTFFVTVSVPVEIIAFRRAVAWVDRGAAASVTATGHSEIRVHSASLATAKDHSTVSAAGSSRVIAQDHSTVNAVGEPTVMAQGKSRVNARGETRVFADNESTVDLVEKARADVSGKAKVYVRSNTAKVVVSSSAARIWVTPETRGVVKVKDGANPVITVVSSFEALTNLSFPQEPLR